MLTTLMIVAAVAGLDQTSKALVVSVLREGAVTTGGRGVRLRHVANRQPAQWGSTTTLSVAWLCVVSGTLLLASSVPSMAQFGLSIAMGGATGNAIDAVLRRRIIDFIDLRVWPIFNLADAAIVAGSILAAVSLATRGS